MAWATLMTSSTVLLTRTKNVIRMSARMLSRQIRPSRPVRSISIVFTEMSMISALCSTGSTTAPVKVTSTRRTLETISALPCSTLRNSRLTMKQHAERDEQDDGEEYADPSGDDIHGWARGAGPAASGPVRARASSFR